ncbi:TlpA family protein disulfide reductase [Chitinophaga horti]|uniref:TlpA family protein disulfide reductase n=1 Tax=Chitinophaga horti TaxID=2920382 RepID=A0ABY6J7K7_9BACT|nr:TlpA disulfide reductase family protein [Chitinophaga horti]UYQ95675.1 TlpA family protein disulfide reductase [Chitinophaga horti]
MQKIITMLAAACILQISAYAQGPRSPKPEATPAEIAALKKAVEKDFKDAQAHKDYIFAVGAESKELQQQYDAWIKANPKSVVIPFAYAEALYQKELPTAKPYLEKVVKLDPKNGKAYQMLWTDAERWGDFAGGREYLRKATQADPKSPDHAFYYASSFEDVDSAKHHDLMLSMPDRYPGTERGAQALYWLAQRSLNPAVKIQVWELARQKYDPGKSNWTSGSMSNYYNYLLTRDLTKAKALADDMLNNDSLRTDKSWLQNKEIADVILAGRALAAAGKYEEAVQKFNTAPKQRFGNAATVLLKDKAAANAAAGNVKAAYDSLLLNYAVDPTDEIYALVTTYGGKLGKDNAAIQQEVWQQRQSKAQPATSFSLDNYLTSGKTSLADLKGKVVLVTYWFPGCGPCRGEFPHFEAVVRKFNKDQLAYVGINIAHEQDPYVAPFMKQSGYSFTPVRDEPEKRGNLKAMGAPTNYLIDKEGRIVFSNFRTDEHNHRTLELMIGELLAR